MSTSGLADEAQRRIDDLVETFGLEPLITNPPFGAANVLDNLRERFGAEAVNAALVEKLEQEPSPALTVEEAQEALAGRPITTDARAGDLTAGDAAGFLRDLRMELSEAELESLFQTGGGLGGERQDRLMAAIEVLGRDRAGQILGIEIDADDIPGEQRTLAGGKAAERVSESPAEPIPEGTASLSEFQPEEEPPEPNGDGNGDGDGADTGNG